MIKKNEIDEKVSKKGITIQIFIVSMGYHTRQSSERRQQYSIFWNIIQD